MNVHKDYVSIEEKLYLIRVFKACDMQMSEGLQLVRLLSCGSEKRLKSFLDMVVPLQYQKHIIQILLN